MFWSLEARLSRAIWRSRLPQLRGISWGSQDDRWRVGPHSDRPFCQGGSTGRKGERKGRPV